MLRPRPGRRACAGSSSPPAAARSAPGRSSGCARATAGRGGRPPELVDGRQDLGRFGDPDEQGPRADRGASTCSRSAPSAIEIVVHPQSVIHSLVEYVDGSVLAQLGAPDMRVPIAHTLAWPERMETPCAAARSGRDRHARLRGARSGALSRRSASPAQALAAGRGEAGHPQCRQRDRGRFFP